MNDSTIEKNELPYVSIIILAYNGERYIKELLESLAGQVYPRHHMEIIVADNGSTDDTIGLARKTLPYVKIVPLGRNYGFAEGNNRALRYASHDIVVFLNQDTQCHRHWLCELAAPFAMDPDSGVVVSNIIPADSVDASMLNRPMPMEKIHLFDFTPFGFARYKIIDAPFAKYIPVRMVSGCSFAINRSVIDEIGGLFDGRFFMYAEDTDLSLRIHKSGRRILLARDSVVYHLEKRGNGFPVQKINTVARAVRNRFFAYYKNMDQREFAFFFPLLLLGSGFKLFELPGSLLKKSILFVPFSFFSMGCMISAMIRIPEFRSDKRDTRL